MTTTQHERRQHRRRSSVPSTRCEAQPAAAKFQFRATNRWVSGTHSRGTIHGFFGLGEEQTHQEAHALRPTTPSS